MAEEMLPLSAGATVGWLLDHGPGFATVDELGSTLVMQVCLTTFNSVSTLTQPKRLGLNLAFSPRHSIPHPYLSPPHPPPPSPSPPSPRPPPLETDTSFSSTEFSDRVARASRIETRSPRTLTLRSNLDPIPNHPRDPTPSCRLRQMSSFLSVNTSPPRSPHAAPAGYFDRIPLATTGRSGVFRPTRRDVLLCLLTLSFSYLLFYSPPNSIPVPRPAASATSTSRYHLPWSSVFSSSKSCPPPAGPRHDTTFTESVKSYGFGGIDEQPAGDQRWDGGEEEAEDDEIVAGETRLLGHAPGWTLFDKLYVFNGSFYVVT